MASYTHIAALFLTITSVSYADSNCAELTGNGKIKCEADVLLNRGIALFQKKDYPDAQKDFKLVMESYPHVKEAVTQAKLYKAKCDRQLKKRAASMQVLTFKKPDTTHGQILSPGETPGETTLQESQKELQPSSNAKTPPSK